MPACPSLLLSGTDRSGRERGRAGHIAPGKAIQVSPSFAKAHVALGASYLKLKDYPSAQKELELGAKLNPDDSKAHYQLAVLYARLKDPKRAQAEMQIIEKLKALDQSEKREGTFCHYAGYTEPPITNAGQFHSKKAARRLSPLCGLAPL